MNTHNLIVVISHNVFWRVSKCVGRVNHSVFLSLNVYLLPHQPRNYQNKKEKTENGSHDDSG